MVQTVGQLRNNSRKYCSWSHDVKMD